MLQFLTCAKNLEESTRNISQTALSSQQINPPFLSSSEFPPLLSSQTVAGPFSTKRQLPSSTPSPDVFDRWRPIANRTGARSFSATLSDKPLLHPVAPFNPTVSSSSRLRSKLQSIKALSTKGTLVCFRCGDSGHLARSCHNALVCFACTKVGHRSKHCPSLTMKPSQSRPLLTDAMKVTGRSLPVMRFAGTQAIRDFDAILRQGVVITDSYHKGAAFISSCLATRFPVNDFIWKVVPLTDDCFFIHPPDPDWRRIALQEKSVLLGDVVFPLEAFDSCKFDGGWEPLPFRIKVYGLPYPLLQGAEIDRLASEIGGLVLQVDPLSSTRENLKYLRLKIGVSERSDIPSCRKMLFIVPGGISRYHWIQFVVEGEGRPPPVRRQGLISSTKFRSTQPPKPPKPVHPTLPVQPPLPAPLPSFLPPPQF